MHIVLGTRGIKHDVDRMITELSSQYLPFAYKSDKVNSMIQVRVCPIQLWDISFPEQHLELMSRSLFHENKGKPQNSKHQKYINMLSKAMGTKKLPDYDPKGKIMPFYNQNTEMISFGYKPDGKLADGVTEGI